VNIQLSKLSAVTLASIYADLSSHKERDTEQLFLLAVSLERRIGAAAAAEMVEAMIAASEETPVMEWVVAQ
jgi:hypothetical protein